MRTQKILADAGGAFKGIVAPGIAIRIDHTVLAPPAGFYSLSLGGGLEPDAYIVGGNVTPLKWSHQISGTGAAANETLIVSVAQTEQEANQLDSTPLPVTVNLTTPSPLPVTGPLTNAQLRASPVPVAQAAPTKALLVAFDAYVGTIFHVTPLAGADTPATMTAAYVAGYVAKTSWFDPSYGFSFAVLEKP